MIEMASSTGLRARSDIESAVNAAARSGSNGLGGWRGRRHHRMIVFGRALGMDSAHRIAQLCVRARSGIIASI
jgi:hypothetical protein